MIKMKVATHLSLVTNVGTECSFNQDASLVIHRIYHSTRN